MLPPLVSFVTWNRLGLTIRNLSALLNTPEDFELHIVDSNSQDDTWSYIQDLNDERIRSKTRLDANRGQIYAVNCSLSKRKKDQFFVTVDSDVNIHTPDWLTRFMEVFEAFPEAGLLGAVSREYYDRYRLPLIKREKRGISYLQMCKGFIEGCCQCLRPSVLNHLGYWNEENCMGDVEMTYRICSYTPYKAGFVPSVEIDQQQSVTCAQCEARTFCSLAFSEKTCFSIRECKYKNPRFRELYGWKLEECKRQMEAGLRTAYSASIHDEESLKSSFYNRHMAEENFSFYEKFSN